MTRRSLALASSFVLCNMLITAALAQDSNEQTTGHSFFGNWFGWGGGDAQSKQKQEQGANPNQPSNRSRQPGAANGAQQQRVVVLVAQHKADLAGQIPNMKPSCTATQMGSSRMQPSIS